MSANDIDFCKSFDIQTLSAEPGFLAIEALHHRMGELYPDENIEDAEAA